MYLYQAWFIFPHSNFDEWICSTDKRCIGNEITSQEIHTLGVTFLEVLKTPQFPFEINWPLVFVYLYKYDLLISSLFLQTIFGLKHLDRKK